MTNPNQRYRKIERKGSRSSNINPIDLSMYSADVQIDIELKAIKGNHTPSPL
jgi:hypothetical protein